MDISEDKENLFAASDAKVHGGMCNELSAIYCKLLSIFPSVEAARPRSTSGIQALCSIHIALEMAKNVLQHCSECSKLYLAITGHSVLLKFEKARCALVDSLRHIDGIVPQTIGCQILEVVRELESSVFILDPLEKQVGDEIIALLQQGRKFDSSDEVECVHRAASRLGIMSSKAALTERRALKKLIARARAEDDKRKESIVAYLLHLMRKYSKLFRSDFCDDNDSLGSTPCSPTVQGSLEDGGPEINSHVFQPQLTKLSSFSFKPNIRRSGSIPVPPEELRCPISLQLMYDPVVISSGQTYERICIEKWFSDGHNTCPKTQQNLSHLCLTPNLCVKGLITSWCEQNGVPVPDGPPESLNHNYCSILLSDLEFTNSSSMDNVGSCKLKGVKVVPLEERSVIEVVEGNELESEFMQKEESDLNMLETYLDFLSVLNGEENLKKKCKVVEQLRLLLMEDEEARIFLGANGFIEALLLFLKSAMNERNEMAQEVGAMALFNLAVNNNRNKEIMLAAGIISLLENMIYSSNSHGSTTALFMNLSCLDEAKPIIGSSPAVPFLVQCLRTNSDPQCKLDALHALYNLSTYPSNINNLLSTGIISDFQFLLPVLDGHIWTEKSVAVLINLASIQAGKDEISSSPNLISCLATILDSGEAMEQEQAVTCLCILCKGNDKCIHLVLKEGVIPALVSISVNGTAKGKEKARKLLMLFREERQRDQPPAEMPQLAQSSENSMPALQSKPMYKSASTRKMRKAFSLFWKKRAYFLHH